MGGGGRRSGGTDTAVTLLRPLLGGGAGRGGALRAKDLEVMTYQPHHCYEGDDVVGEQTDSQLIGNTVYCRRMYCVTQLYRSYIVYKHCILYTFCQSGTKKKKTHTLTHKHIHTKIHKRTHTQVLKGLSDLVSMSNIGLISASI